MKKRTKHRITAGILAAVMGASGVAVCAEVTPTYHFWSGIFLSNKGYELGRDNKVSGSNFGRIQINYSNWNNLSTNFLICQPGTGIPYTPNCTIENCDRIVHNTYYYTKYRYKYELLSLRANSAQDQANYTIGGYWSPNSYNMYDY